MQLGYVASWEQALILVASAYSYEATCPSWLPYTLGVSRMMILIKFCVQLCPGRIQESEFDGVGQAMDNQQEDH